jgi:hypothetical protein
MEHGLHDRDDHVARLQLAGASAAGTIRVAVLSALVVRWPQLDRFRASRGCVGHQTAVYASVEGGARASNALHESLVRRVGDCWDDEGRRFCCSRTCWLVETRVAQVYREHLTV